MHWTSCAHQHMHINSWVYKEAQAGDFRKQGAQATSEHFYTLSISSPEHQEVPPHVFCGDHLTLPVDTLKTIWKSHYRCAAEGQKYNRQQLCSKYKGGKAPHKQMTGGGWGEGKCRNVSPVKVRSMRTCRNHYASTKIATPP